MRVNWSPSDIKLDKAEELSKRQSSSQKALQDAAQQFEAIFLQLLMEEMRRTIPENDLFGDRKAEKMFQSMLDQEMSINSSQAQSVGLAKLIYEQMSRYVSDQD
ncbi:MAG: hypothetical protein GX971_06220 [Firmicutes bacterium]|nr:hypothetical protein [Bacillota bacterium]